MQVTSAQAAEAAKGGWSYLLTRDLHLVEAVGGLSASSVWRAESDGRQYALKCFPSSWRKHLTAAHGVMEFVEGERPKWVPCPFAVGGDGSRRTIWQDGELLWELTPWLPGEADFVEHPSECRAESMAAALAELHTMLEAIPVSTDDLSQRYVDAVTEVVRQMHKFDYGTIDSHLRSSGHFTGADSSRTMVERGVTIVNQDVEALRQFRLSSKYCWGDAWCNNFLFAGDVVVGLVDFAAVRVDTPLADVARLVGSIGGEHPEWRAATIESYSRIRSLSSDDLAAMEKIHDIATVVSFSNWVRWIGDSGVEASTAAAAKGRLLHFARRLRRLVAGGA